MLLNSKHHESFNDFFSEDNIKILRKIEEELVNEEITPSFDKVLRFMQQDLMSVKVIWLGQDPYFQPNVATGRSFEPNDLYSWDAKFKQVSLKNIIRNIYRSYYPENFSKINTYSDIMIERRLGNFNILDPKEWFNNLEFQGVMFLNTYFTCRVNCPNSHRKIWREFSLRVIEYIYKKNPTIIWFLWGNEAKSVLQIEPNLINYSSNHPMICNIKKEDDFLNNQCFINTKELINWLGSV